MTDTMIEPLPATTPDQELTAHPPARRRRTLLRFVVAFLVGLVAAMAIGAGGLYAFDQQYIDRVLPGVRVGGVDLSGKTQPEAAAALNAAFASYGQGPRHPLERGPSSLDRVRGHRSAS